MFAYPLQPPQPKPGRFLPWIAIGGVLPLILLLPTAAICAEGPVAVLPIEACPSAAHDECAVALTWLSQAIADAGLDSIGGKVLAKKTKGLARKVIRCGERNRCIRKAANQGKVGGIFLSTWGKDALTLRYFATGDAALSEPVKITHSGNENFENALKAQASVFLGIAGDTSEDDDELELELELELPGVDTTEIEEEEEEPDLPALEVLAVPDLEGLPPADKPKEDGSTGSGVTIKKGVGSAQPQHSSAMLYTGFVLSGLGAAVLGAGGYFGLQSKQLSDQADDRSKGSILDQPTALSTYNAQAQNTLWANIAFGAGGLALAAGCGIIINELLGDSDQKSGADTKVSLLLGTDSAQATFSLYW